MFLPALKSRIGDLPSDNDIYVGKLIMYCLRVNWENWKLAGKEVVRMMNKLKYDTLQTGSMFLIILQAMIYL
ncbi:hypothetical protein CS542_01540 [Pedobacter sp. IW39]|nr:hypothetical protein CS542_01540 [Pedobacter sp. IW39]